MINACINVTSYPACISKNEERTSMYTGNKGEANIPPCRTPLKIVKYDDISAPHLMHNS